MLLGATPAQLHKKMKRLLLTAFGPVCLLLSQQTSFGAIVTNKLLTAAEITNLVYSASTTNGVTAAVTNQWRIDATNAATTVVSGISGVTTAVTNQWRIDATNAATTISTPIATSVGAQAAVNLLNTVPATRRIASTNLYIAFIGDSWSGNTFVTNVLNGSFYSNRYVWTTNLAVNGSGLFQTGGSLTNNTWYVYTNYIQPVVTAVSATNGEIHVHLITGLNDQGRSTDEWFGNWSNLVYTIRTDGGKVVAYTIPGAETGYESTGTEAPDIYPGGFADQTRLGKNKLIRDATLSTGPFSLERLWWACVDQAREFQDVLGGGDYAIDRLHLNNSGEKRRASFVNEVLTLGGDFAPLYEVRRNFGTLSVPMYTASAGFTNHPHGSLNFTYPGYHTNMLSIKGMTNDPENSKLGAAHPGSLALVTNGTAWIKSSGQSTYYNRFYELTASAITNATVVDTRTNLYWGVHSLWFFGIRPPDFTNQVDAVANSYPIGWTSTNTFTKMDAGTCRSAVWLYSTGADSAGVQVVLSLVDSVTGTVYGNWSSDTNTISGATPTRYFFNISTTATNCPNPAYIHFALHVIDGDGGDPLCVVSSGTITYSKTVHSAFEWPTESNTGWKRILVNGDTNSISLPGTTTAGTVTTSSFYISTNEVCPTPAVDSGHFWNSNYVLYWVTPYATNLVDASGSFYVVGALSVSNGPATTAWSGPTNSVAVAWPWLDYTIYSVTSDCEITNIVGWASGQRRRAALQFTNATTSNCTIRLPLTWWRYGTALAASSFTLTNGGKMFKLDIEAGSVTNAIGAFAQ